VEHMVSTAPPLLEGQRPPELRRNVGSRPEEELSHVPGFDPDAVVSPLDEVSLADHRFCVGS